MTEASPTTGTGTRAKRRRKAPTSKPAPEANTETKTEAAGDNGKEKPPRKKREPKTKWSPVSEIKVVTPEQKNPKRAGTASFDRFALYPTGKDETGKEKVITVAAALEAGVWSGDLNWDYDHGFIEIDGERNPLKERAAPKKKAAAKGNGENNGEDNGEDTAGNDEEATEGAESDEGTSDE